MLNDAVIEMMSIVCDEEMFAITQQIMDNYGRRGAIFIGAPSRSMTFATRKDIRMRATMYPHNEDIKLLLHLISSYSLYTEAVLVFVSESTQELIGMTKVTIDTIKLNTFSRGN